MGRFLPETILSPPRTLFGFGRRVKPGPVGGSTSILPRARPLGLSGSLNDAVASVVMDECAQGRNAVDVLIFHRHVVDAMHAGEASAATVRRTIHAAKLLALPQFGSRNPAVSAVAVELVESSGADRFARPAASLIVSSKTYLFRWLTVVSTTRPGPSSISGQCSTAITVARRSRAGPSRRGRAEAERSRRCERRAA